MKVTHRKGLRIVKDRWDEIIGKLKDTYPNCNMYPFSKRILYYMSGKDPKVPSDRTLNKVFKFMKWDYEIPNRDANFKKNILQPKLNNISLIMDNYDRIDWSSAKLNRHQIYFFKDTKKTGSISLKYGAPPVKVTDRIIKNNLS